MKNIIKEKTFNFALRIIKVYKSLQDKHEFILSKQLIRSGTALGAMIREADYAESKLDFVHKMAIAQKEANETDYWLELLYKSDYLTEAMFNSIIEELNEILKIISSIILTTKNNIESKR